MGQIGLFPRLFTCRTTRGPSECVFTARGEEGVQFRWGSPPALLIPHSLTDTLLSDSPVCLHHSGSEGFGARGGSEDYQLRKPLHVFSAPSLYSWYETRRLLQHTRRPGVLRCSSLSCITSSPVCHLGLHLVKAWALTKAFLPCAPLLPSSHWLLSPWRSIVCLQHFYCCIYLKYYFSCV